MYFDVFNFIYKHHDQYTSYTHNFSFAKVLDGTPVNLTKLSKVAFSASDRSFYLLNRKWVPTLSYSCFQFFNGEQLNPLFKHSITQLRPYAIVHRIKVRRIRWQKVFCRWTWCLLLQDILGICCYCDLLLCPVGEWTNDIR